MNRCCLRLLTILTLLSFGLNAQITLPGLTGPEEERVEVPQPLELDVTWWTYIEGAGENLPKRIQLLVTSLQQLSDPSLAQDPEVKARINRLVQALEAYPDSLTQEPSSLQAVPDLLEKYKFSDIWALAERVRKQQVELLAGQNELRQSQIVIDSNQSLLDSMVVAYRGAEELSRDKLLLGLDIMFRRVTQAVEIQRLRVLQVEVERLGQAVAGLRSQLGPALRRVAAVKVDSVKIRDLERQVEETRQRAYASESMLTRIGEENRELRALRRQQAIGAQIENSLARLDLAKKSTEEVLYFLKEEPERSQELTGTVSQILDEVTAQLGYWKQTAEQDIASARGALSLMQEEASRERRVNEQRLNQAQKNLVHLQQLKNEAAEKRLILGEVEEMVYETQRSALQLLSLAWGEAGDTSGDLLNWFRTTLFRVGDAPVTSGDLLYMIFIIGGAYLLSKLIQHTLQSLGQQRPEMRMSAVYTLGRLLHYFIMAAGTLIALTSIGLNFRNLALVAGALSVGIGFGLQSVINNFVSGIILLFESSIKLGDYIELESGLKGSVKEINVRSTIIASNDGIDVLVPNSQLVSDRVINWTFRDSFRRVRIPFSVAYGTDKELLIKAVMEAVDSIPLTLKRVKAKAPVVRMRAFGSDGLEFELVVWVNAYASKRYGTAQSAYLWAIDDKFREYGIEVPYPQRVVRVTPE